MSKTGAIEQSSQRPLDVICLGRAGVDLYARESHSDFTHVSGFEKFVGGSPANIAVALSRLQHNTGLIGAVSQDGLGQYVRQYLQQQHIDTSHLYTLQDGSRTSLAVTEIRPDAPEVVIYRNQAADLALTPEHISEAYIASSQWLLVSGTALSQSPSREAVFVALEYAQRHQTNIVLDMDYRAYSWSSPATAAIYYHLAASKSQLVIGNQEEFAVLAPLGFQVNQSDAIAQTYLQGHTQVVILKKGSAGCEVFTPKENFQCGIYPVEAQKPFGAGDAFAGALLSALIHGQSLQQAVQQGSAAAAINVSRRSCSEAMPTQTEIDTFMRENTPVITGDHCG